MRNRRGQSAVCTLALVGLGFSMVGCRTTTSHLASIPGMGWLDRSGDEYGEGWADWKPANAPDLPSPSSTSEPTSTTPTSGLASKQGANAELAGYGQNSYPHSGRRFADSYLRNQAGSSTKPGPGGYYTGQYNTGSSYGNLASDRAGSTAGPSTQRGFYGAGPAPNYASTSSAGQSGATQNFGGETPRYGNYSSSTPAPGTGNDGLSGSRYGASGAAAYTADRSSRFGAPQTSTPSRGGAWGDTGKQEQSGYTPPGFPSSSSHNASPTNGQSPLGANSTAPTSRFDSYQGTAQSAVARANENLRNATSTAQDSAGANGAIVNSYAEAARQTMDSIQQSANQLGEAANGFGQGLGGGGQGVVDQAKSSVESYARSAQLQAQQVGASAATQLRTTANEYKDNALQAANSQFQSRYENATSTVDEYLQSAKSSFQQAGAAAQNYADSTANAAGAAAQNPLGQPAAGGTQPPPSYPTTSTPEAYQFTPGAQIPPATSIKRSPTPWRPGSTGDYRGSNVAPRNTHSPTADRKELGSSIQPSRKPLLLAVGDRSQFPRALY